MQRDNQPRKHFQQETWLGKFLDVACTELAELATPAEYDMHCQHLHLKLVVLFESFGIGAISASNKVHFVSDFIMEDKPVVKQYFALVERVHIVVLLLTGKVYLHDQ